MGEDRRACLALAPLPHGEHSALVLRLRGAVLLTVSLASLHDHGSSSHFRSVSVHQKQRWNCVRSSFCASWEDAVCFPFWSVNVMGCID